MLDDWGIWCFASWRLDLRWSSGTLWVFKGKELGLLLSFQAGCTKTIVGLLLWRLRQPASRVTAVIVWRGSIPETCYTLGKEKNLQNSEAQMGGEICGEKNAQTTGRGQETCKIKSEERDGGAGGVPLLHQAPVSQISDLEIFWFSKRDKVNYIRSSLGLLRCLKAYVM